MYLHWLLQHRGITIFVALVLIVAAGGGLLGIQISTDNRVFYGPKNHYFADFLDFESQFTTNDNIVFVIAGDTTVTEGRFPEAIRWLTNRAFALEHTIRVDSLANYPYPIADEDSLSVEPLLDWACPESGPCTRPIQSAVEELELYSRLVGADLRSAGVIATLSIERGAVGLIEALQNDIRALTREFREEFPTLDIYYTGGVPMMAAFAESTNEDLSLLLPLAFGTIFIVLMAVFGSAHTAAALMGTGLATAVIVIGSAGWFGLVINNATSIAPIVILTLVITSAMHLVMHYNNNLSATHESTSAIEQSLTSTRANFAPLTFSAVTSAASLASLALVDSPPLRELGLLSAAGTLVGYGLSLTLLPVWLSLTPKPRSSKLGQMVQESVNRYARSVERHGGPAIPGLLILIVASIGLAQLTIDDDFVRFFDESVDFRVQTDKTTELLAGPNHIELVLRAKDEETVFTPEYLQYLMRLTQEARSHPLVANAHSFSDVMSHLSETLYEKQISAEMTESELNQLFLIYELSLNIGQSNTDLVNSAHNAARISILLKESTSSDIQELESTLYNLHQSQNTDFELTVTGENIPVAHLSRMNIESMAFGIGAALLGTAAVIGIWFRSARLGIVAFAATTLPVLAGFGAWGWSGQSIGLAATAIVALTIGVVIDDTAHYLYRFLDSRRRLDLEPKEAAAYSTHKVGAAIVSTSISLGAGLGLLALSSFQVNRIFGIVTCLIIALALLFDLMILPRLTIWAVENKR